MIILDNIKRKDFGAVRRTDRVGTHRDRQSRVVDNVFVVDDNRRDQSSDSESPVLRPTHGASLVVSYDFEVVGAEIAIVVGEDREGY